MSRNARFEGYHMFFCKQGQQILGPFLLLKNWLVFSSFLYFENTKILCGRTEIFSFFYFKWYFIA